MLVVIWFGAAAVILAISVATRRTPHPGWRWRSSRAWPGRWGSAGWVFWRRLDEMAQEARKMSWLVGSTGAIVATAPFMLLWLMKGGAFLVRLLGGRGTSGAYFPMGWTGLVFAQLLGSLIASAVWRARMR